MTSIVPYPRAGQSRHVRTGVLFLLVAGLSMRLGWISSGKPAPQRLPDDLLADVLGDNGLRAREEIRRRPIESGPWG